MLGKGSGGTCVFEGKLHGRDVAVKRMLVQHSEVARLEIDFFQRVDLHPNILTYFHQERDKNFIYLAIEKCEGDLEQLIRLMKIYKEQGTTFLQDSHSSPSAQQAHPPSKMSVHGDLNIIKKQIQESRVAQLFKKKEECLGQPKFMRNIIQ